MNILDIRKQDRSAIRRILEREKLIAEAMENGEVTEATSIEDITEPKLFFNFLQDVSAQQKAPRIERFIANKMGWAIVPSSEDRGDFLTPDGKYVESKISTNNQAEQANLKQLRMWQKVDYYLCGYIDQYNLENSIIYYLTKEQMQEQVDKYGSVMHGTGKAVENNKNIEMAITIKVYSERSEKTSEWNQKFKNDDLIKKILNV